MIVSGETNYVCPLFKCGQALTDGPNGEAHWCPFHLASFSIEQIEGPSKWRAMSWDQRAKCVAEQGDGVVRMFGITDEDVSDTIAFEKRQATAVLFSGNVAPSKTALINLAKGLSDVGALKEIVDNALDCSQRKRGGERIQVRIELNAEKGFVCVTDDAGGMTHEEMLRCMTLGSHTPNGHLDNVIGRFGVGAKEAMYHFGRELTIRSSDLRDPIGLELFVPSNWLEHDDWNVDIRTADVERGTSSIRIDVLEHVDFDKDRIGAELWNTYARRIQTGRLDISVNGEPLKGSSPPPVLLFPPELYPRKYAFFVENVSVDVQVALLDDAPSESGIFFYAFGRLYAHWLWNNPLANTIVPRPPQHHLNTHIRLDVDFRGRIEDIPINSNKDEVVINSSIFKPLAKITSKIVQPYLGIVSWLSKDNNMSYLSRTFAGLDKAHQSITSESLGLNSEIELGRVYDGMPLSKNRIADSSLMQLTLARDRAPATTEKPKTPPTIVAETEAAPERSNLDVRVGPAPSGKQSDNLFGLDDSNHRVPDVPPQQLKSTLITVSLLTDDSRQIHQLKEQIESAAKSMGVRVVVS